MRNGPNGHVTDHPPEPPLAASFSDLLNGVVHDAKSYLLAEKEHLTLQATGLVAVLLSKVVRLTAVLVLLAAMVLFLNIALALYVGELLGSFPLGFVIMAGSYLLMLGSFLVWWSKGGRDRFVIDRINDLDGNEE